MIPFRIELRPGAPVFEQIAYAAKRAIISGRLQPGDPFPSVRALSREAHINPNTAAKVITALLNEGLIESHPGIGTVVATPPDARKRDRRDLLTRQIEPLVVEALRLGLTEEAVLDAVRDHWEQLTQQQDSKAGDRRK